MATGEPVILDSIVSVLVECTCGRCMEMSLKRQEACPDCGVVYSLKLEIVENTDPD